MENNPMIEKLRKLIAHERSAREIGNLNEAEAFAEKVQNLLTTHKLSMSEVDFEEREESEPIDWGQVDGADLRCRDKKTKTYWRVTIASAIAEINSCDVVQNGLRSFFFVGRTSDRELAKMLYIYMIELGEELCKKNANEQRKEEAQKFLDLNDITIPESIAALFPKSVVPPYAEKAFQKWMKVHQNSWKVGFGTAISERLHIKYEDMIGASQSGALVHIKKDALAVDDFLKGKTRQSRTISSGSVSEAGFAQGQATGNAVNLSPNRFSGATGRASRLLGS